MSARAAMKRPMRRSHPWRGVIGWCALLALAFPSLGPLPWLAVEFEHARIAAHERAADGHSDRPSFDASAIPGSPTHPEDHHCAECEVLKHLARCIPAAPAPPVVPSIAACDLVLPAPAALAPQRREAVLPPVRAPPLAVA